MLWERGAPPDDLLVCAADNTPGPACSPRTPLARYESTYTAWPPPTATPRELFLGPDGRLGPTAPDVPDDEVRAWTIKKGTKAPQAAGKIHSDFERGFIRAEVMKYDELIALGGEAELKKAGKLAVQGKEYIVVDGDILNIRFNI